MIFSQLRFNRTILFFLFLLLPLIQVMAQTDLVVIDQTYSQKNQLLTALPAQAKKLTINSNENPWTQIRHALKADQQIKNIHVFVNTSYNSFLFGGKTYNTSEVSKDFEISMLEGLYQGEKFNLVIYDCNLASNEEGKNFLKLLSNRALMNVFSSQNCNDIFENISLDYKTDPSSNITSILK